MATVSFVVQDPKRRRISAAPFRDRVVHHAVHAVIAPLFERGFIAHSYANRADKGTHRAVRRYERLRDRHRYVLRADIFRYFPAIDHEVLKVDVRRRIRCRRTLNVLDLIVDGSNPQEPVHVHYPGDNLFTPYERRRGLPIGNLTSQLFANVYLDRFDHYVTEVLRAPYLRYVDDFALFADDRAQLEAWRGRAESFLARRRLSLHPEKTYVAPTAAPATFLGFELRAGGRRRLPEANVRRFRNRLRGLRDRWRAGTVSQEEVEQRVSRLGGARGARRHMAAAPRNLPGRVVRAVRGDRFRRPDRPPARRVVRGGSWNNNAEYVRPSGRNRNRAGNRDNNSGFRVASTPRARAAAVTAAAGARGSVQGWS